MTVADAGKVDGMGLSKDGQHVVLMVADHLPWSAEDHFQLLEHKIGAYLDFVSSGQLINQLPAAKGLQVLIDLRCEHEPDGQAIAFLEAAKKQLCNAGVEFAYGLLPAGY